MYAPSRLEAAITPDEIDKALASHNYSQAINMALLLGSRPVLKRAVDSVGTSSIDLVQKSIDLSSIDALMRFLAEEIVSTALLQCVRNYQFIKLFSHHRRLPDTLNST